MPDVLRCTTASYHAGDFRRKKIWIGRQTRRISQSPIRSHTRCVGGNPSCKSRRPPGAQSHGPLAIAPAVLDHDRHTNKKPGARPGFALKR